MIAWGGGGGGVGFGRLDEVVSEPSGVWGLTDGALGVSGVDRGGSQTIHMKFSQYSFGDS